MIVVSQQVFLLLVGGKVLGHARKVGMRFGVLGWHHQGWGSIV